MGKKKLPLWPAMECVPGCGDCCGIAPCTKGEASSVVAYARAHGVVPKRQGLTCPMFQGGKCQVHAVRPRICQAYGHEPRLQCSRGKQANGDPDKVRAWVFAAGDMHTTVHAAFGMGDEVRGIV